VERGNGNVGTNSVRLEERKIEHYSADSEENNIHHLKIDEKRGTDYERLFFFASNSREVLPTLFFATNYFSPQKKLLLSLAI
jgi:hypothetical protein